jgi:hypothetical protein
MMTSSQQPLENKENPTGLTNFDFSSIEEMDPSLCNIVINFIITKGEGHRILYDREIPFELRIHDDNGPQEVGTLEAIRVKVLVLV